MCVRARMCVCVCVRARTCVCVRVCVLTGFYLQHAPLHLCVILHANFTNNHAFFFYTFPSTVGHFVHWIVFMSYSH